MDFDSITDKVSDYLDDEDGFNGLLVSGIAAGGAFLVRRALGYGWKKTMKTDPPKNPADRDVSLKEALAWTLLSGVIAALVRLFIRRNVVVGARKA
ncbi:MAG: DUF4235 domain-containing protein [Tunicatimonas sp.]